MSRRGSPYHAGDQLTIPTECFSCSPTEPRADPSRTNPSLHRTDVCTQLEALPKGTSGKSRTRVKDHDAKMHVRWNQPRARFGAVELRTEVMTLRVHAETMPQAGLGQSEILLPRSVADRFFKSAAEVVVRDFEKKAPVEGSAWDTLELERREPGFNSPTMCSKSTTRRRTWQTCSNLHG